MVKVGTPIFGILLAPADRRLLTAQTPDNVQRVNGMVLEDRRATAKEMSVQLGIGEACAEH
jgi:hypothetical protein